GTPVEIRFASSAFTSTRRRSGLAAAFVLAASGASSTSDPKTSQPGHLPNHLPAAYPHSVHANWTAALAMESRLARAADGSVPTRCRMCAEFVTSSKRLQAGPPPVLD